MDASHKSNMTIKNIVPLAVIITTSGKACVSKKLDLLVVMVLQPSIKKGNNTVENVHHYTSSETVNAS